MSISTKIVRVPVKLVDGQWELLYGGPVKVQNGSIGELHLEKSNFSDSTFLKALIEKRSVEILPQGTELRVALTIRPQTLPRSLLSLLLNPDDTPHLLTTALSVDTRFIPVHLAGPTEAQRKKSKVVGGLWLQLEGMEPRGIESGSVRLQKETGIDLEVVGSLNHAFTRLSEVFEPWRMSHTGSIYERVFYRDSDTHWHPLKDLRDRELVNAERKVIKALWEMVEKQIGMQMS